MAMNNYQWPNERSIQKKTVSVHEIDAITTLTTQVHSLTQQLKTTQLTANAILQRVIFAMEITQVKSVKLGTFLSSTICSFCVKLQPAEQPLHCNI